MQQQPSSSCRKNHSLTLKKGAPSNRKARLFIADYLLLDCRQTHVNELSAFGLMDVNGEHVFARFERVQSRFGNRERLIRTGVARHVERQHAVDINFGVFVVIEQSIATGRGWRVEHRSA